MSTTQQQADKQAFKKLADEYAPTTREERIATMRHRMGSNPCPKLWAQVLREVRVGPHGRTAGLRGERS